MEKKIFRIINFTQVNGNDFDCEAIQENGKKLIVDPFVGCAWDYENRKALLNTWFEAEGFFSENPGMEHIFLPSEGKMKVIQKV